MPHPRTVHLDEEIPPNSMGKPWCKEVGVRNVFQGTA